MVPEWKKVEYVAQTYPLISEQGIAYLQFVAQALLLVQNPPVSPIYDSPKSSGREDVRQTFTKVQAGD
jgi:hypothetical protein